MTQNIIGYTLNANTLGCTVGCRMHREQQPAFGDMIKIPLQDERIIYGVIANIQVLDDGLVRQLATTEPIQEEVIRDNRENRTVPLEFSILFLGFKEKDKIFHLLPPNPPLSLETVYLCSDQEMIAFSHAGNTGYTRYMIAEKDILNFELVTIHFRNIYILLAENEREAWLEKTTQTLVHLYRNDYETLCRLLQVFSETNIFG